MPHQSDLAEQITARMQAEGYPEWAKCVQAALFGSTGTEINMALGSTVREFLKSRPKISAELKGLIKELQREIGNALRWR